MPTDLSKFNNDWYKPGGKVKRALWYCFNNWFLLNKYNPFGGLKKFVLRMFGAKIGKGVVIKQRVNVKYPWFLEIGDHSWIGEGVWIDNLGKVKIGPHCCISQGALLLCGNHNYKKSTFDLMVGDITLEEGVWIGAKSVVSGGVTCFSHAVLSAGSVANKDLEAYKIYQGNPAQIVRERVIEE
ncbi:WcaF family extracellular polysaccharide biosynthesis acetyltransferase [Paracrocinitomix mangrovi]|uniref:WcaF family extracellular polysaccharide biosynthesis acetyltransferase n=1 Tax=Paracrocinitomix mangrovi TaxID=2862509 RepID=UPI001C8D9E03|nr:WcaF family extracellular polysaccharide biosynthesis acetyltransferase [Paracrocinitomix mangrovi]UKN02080.1 WcaF family extracellular polysaccharide biosynthesis acetyltransferase [Paracrocinitomix mangrovi]